MVTMRLYVYNVACYICLFQQSSYLNIRKSNRSFFITVSAPLSKFSTMYFQYCHKYESDNC